MEAPKPQAPEAVVAANCLQVAFIVRNQTRPDWKELAESQLREAAAAIEALLGQRPHPVQEIASERARQILSERWTPAHDDEHGKGELAKAAGCYAIWTASPNYGSGGHPAQWPWSPHWFKPTERRRDLIKAGALIVAEIDRIDRAEAAGS